MTTPLYWETPRTAMARVGLLQLLILRSLSSECQQWASRAPRKQWGPDLGRHYAAPLREHVEELAAVRYAKRHGDLLTRR
jgi:hypothetical protein